MKKLLFLTISLILSSAFTSNAQNGKVRGKVIEDANGLPIIGANVFVKNTTTGTITDLDGAFELSLPEGSYDIQISFITFTTQTFEKVEVKANQVYQLGEIFLQSESLDLKEFVVEATQRNVTETAILRMKSKSPAMIDGISAATFKLAGDGTAAEAVKRVTGVTVEGGKYIYVRGLGDRYTKTMLNGVDVPGLDPDRNSLQMDIFPSAFIDNIIIAKNFSAEMPADFTGGLVNIETVAFPDEKYTNVSMGVSVNPSMHFNPNYVTYQGSSTDFLGFDDGQRALPAAAKRNRIPSPINGSSTEEVQRFIKSFDPNLGTERKTSLMDYDFSVSTGNQISLKGKNNEASDWKLGYNFSLTYKNQTRFYDDVTFGEYQNAIAPEELEMKLATIQTGELGENNVLIGGMAGIAIKNKNNKIKLTLLKLQNGESRAGNLFIENDPQAIGQSGYIAYSDNLEYNQRALNNILLDGEHILKNKSWQINWKLSGVLSNQEDPDIRKTAFTWRTIDTLFNAGAGGNPSRIWRDLSEINTTSKIDVTKTFTFNKKEAKLLFGANQTYKARDYEILFFDIQFLGNQSWPTPDPNLVLNEQFLYPNQPNSVYYQSGNNNPNPNQYSSTISNTAGYISTELYLTQKLRTILGVRAENYVQRHTGRNQTYASGDIVNGKSLNNDIVLNSLNFFPSLNFIYGLTENQNLRASYSQTIARPSFKELSFAQILDPITNRIFNGSLFEYPAWNGELVETNINNIDLRWEYISKLGETVSMSLFYKQFINPIELVRIPEQQTSTEFQPRNVGNGELFGFEFEFRKSLMFLSSSLENFSVSGNFTFVESIIDMTTVEFNARKNFEKEGETIKNTRQMAGQAPYVINAGLSYRDIEKGLNAGVFYNVKGPTLFIVGSGLFPDIYVDPFHSLNASISKSFGENKKHEVDLGISNILNDNLDIFYEAFNAQTQPFTNYGLGTSFSLGYKYKF